MLLAWQETANAVSAMVGTLLGLIGLAGLLYQIRQARVDLRTQRLTQSMAFLEEMREVWDGKHEVFSKWLSEHYPERSTRTPISSEHAKLLAAMSQDQSPRKELREKLAALDRLALYVEHGIIDFEMVKHTSRGRIISVYRTWWPYVEEVKGRSRNFPYQHFQALAKRLEEDESREISARSKTT